MELQELGEVIYGAATMVEPNLAPKITGMLLDLPKTDVCSIISDATMLLNRIDEAMAVLSLDRKPVSRSIVVKKGKVSPFYQ